MSNKPARVELRRHRIMGQMLMSFRRGPGGPGPLLSFYPRWLRHCAVVLTAITRRRRRHGVLSKLGYLGYLAADCWATCVCVCSRQAVHGAVRETGLLFQRRHLPSYDVTKQQKVLRVSTDIYAAAADNTRRGDGWDELEWFWRKRDMMINCIRLQYQDQVSWPEHPCSNFLPCSMWTSATNCENKTTNSSIMLQFFVYHFHFTFI